MTVQTATMPQSSRAGALVDVCAVTDLETERGRAALLPDGTQVALFLLPDGAVRVVSNCDPYAGANVLSRGIVGTRLVADGTETPTIASPLHKQVWDLRTGEVLETHGREARHLPVHAVEIDGGRVLIGEAETR
ncbi:nitrite reductase (NAD(P)H) small subunit [Microbacterium halotolerans]|uniref:nitrite reductase (NAD(P)H) small subunit n=1 Tax=Microbacterium halotolerans TaxID=246613 RepID=UPI000E6AD9E5|nr:nitrite reductase (NAD(P)H) small subunit [Microbacterium halotolerans]